MHPSYSIMTPPTHTTGHVSQQLHTGQAFRMAKPPKSSETGATSCSTRTKRSYRHEPRVTKVFVLFLQLRTQINHNDGSGARTGTRHPRFQVTHFGVRLNLGELQFFATLVPHRWRSESCGAWKTDGLTRDMLRVKPSDGSEARILTLHDCP